MWIKGFPFTMLWWPSGQILIIVILTKMLRIQGLALGNHEKSFLLTHQFLCAGDVKGRTNTHQQHHWFSKLTWCASLSLWELRVWECLQCYPWDICLMKFLIYNLLFPPPKVTFYHLFNILISESNVFLWAFEHFNIFKFLQKDKLRWESRLNEIITTRISSNRCTLYYKSMYSFNHQYSMILQINFLSSLASYTGFIMHYFSFCAPNLI